MDDQKLLHLIEKNPNKGIDKAMKQYGKSVNTICTSILQGLEEGLVDEAVSDTFVKLWRNCQKVDLTVNGSLKSYLYAIARNAALDVRRKNGYSVLSLEDENVKEPEAQYSVEEEGTRQVVNGILRQAVEQLDPPDNQVFWCKYFFDMRNKEIADRLQLSEKKVENILYRGKGRLKDELAKKGIDCYEDG